MDVVPLALLVPLLPALILLSALFSAAETAVLSLNRYRLQYLANSGHKGARRARFLLKRPERLTSFTQVVCTLLNILAAATAALLAAHLLDAGLTAIAVTGLLLTPLLVVLTQLLPKSLAAAYPERIAFTFSHLLKPLLRLSRPWLALLHAGAGRLQRLTGADQAHDEPLSQKELRAMADDDRPVPARHQSMLLNILDLEQMTIEDIMVPRNEIVGIDIEADDDDLLRRLGECRYTRVPVYRHDIDNIAGFLHLRSVAQLAGNGGKLHRRALLKALEEPYFVPESTPLHTQLLNFQQQKRRIASVVDEYGTVRGLVTLEDILEEIVGEFTSNLDTDAQEIVAQDDGSYIIDGAAGIREINRALDWKLPVDGPKTLSGLLLEHLEGFPDGQVGLRVGNYKFETETVQGNIVKRVHASASTQH